VHESIEFTQFHFRQTLNVQIPRCIDSYCLSRYTGVDRRTRGAHMCVPAVYNSEGDLFSACSVH